MILYVQNQMIQNLYDNMQEHCIKLYTCSMTLMESLYTGSIENGLGFHFFMKMNRLILLSCMTLSGTHCIMITGSKILNL